MAHDGPLSAVQHTAAAAGGGAADSERPELSGTSDEEGLIINLDACAKFPQAFKTRECEGEAQSVASNVTTDAGDSLLERSPLPVSVRQQLQHALQQAAKDGDLREGPGRNVQSFNAVLNACMKSLGCAAAEQWFQKMRQASVTPNQASYAMLIQGWARAGELSLAQRWMEARRSHGTPNQGCLLAILALCQNRMTDAEWTLQEMVRQFPSTRLQGYTVLVDAAKLEKAEKWMRPIDEGGEATVVSYRATLDACAKFPQALKARENERRFSTALITALASCGYFKVLQSMTHFGLLGDAVTFSSLLAACAKAREIKCAEQGSRCYPFLLMQQRGVGPNFITYTSVARAYANCGKWQEAEKLSYSMEASGLLINDFFLYALLLAYVLASLKQPKRTEETFLRVIRAGHIDVNQHLMSVLCRALGRHHATEVSALAQISKARKPRQCTVNSSLHGVKRFQ